MFVFSVFVCAHRGCGNRVNVARAFRRFYPVTARCEQYLPNISYVIIEGRVESRRTEMIKKRANKDMGKEFERKKESRYMFVA
jgi:hypothetical protein